MNLKQWKTLEKCRKLGDASGYCFVRGNYLYAGNNYAAVRLHNADTLTGVDAITHGCFVSKSGVIHGDFVVMGVRFA